MITGEQLQRARQTARMTQEELANAVGVTLRSVGNWERGGGVPRNREALVRDVLGGYLAANETASAGPLSQVSDMALLAELGRRLARTQQPAPPTPLRPTLTPETIEGMAARGGHVVTNPELTGQQTAGEHNQDTGGWEPA